jgi:hypothetical protein
MEVCVWPGDGVLWVGDGERSKLAVEGFGEGGTELAGASTRFCFGGFGWGSATEMTEILGIATISLVRLCPSH